MDLLIKKSTGDPFPSVDRGPALEDDRAAEVGSVDLDDVFFDEDSSATAEDHSEVDELKYSSVFDFAMACLRRQPPHKTAVVRTLARYLMNASLRRI